MARSIPGPGDPVLGSTSGFWSIRAILVLEPRRHHTRTMPMAGLFTRRLYPPLLTSALLPVGEWFTGMHVLPRLRLLREAQWWPREVLVGERDAALRQLLRVAHRDVVFYRRLFHEAGVSPADIRSAEDLLRLPVVTKAMLRAGNRADVTRPTRWPVHSTCSSGSTGDPFVVLEDSETAARRQAAFFLALEWAGWRIGEPHAQSGARFPRGRMRLLKDAFLRCYYFSAVDLDEAHLDKVLARIERRGIEHIWGFPCSLPYLAERALATGWRQPLRSVVTWGDAVDARCRQLLESAFKTRVTDTYGCGEGMQVAAQCGAGSDYHVHMLDTVVELLDERDRPVPPGTPGRVVLTRLIPGAMPFIRYDIGDIATSGGEDYCSCGRQHYLIRKIEGRVSDAIMTPSGRRLIVYSFARVFDQTPGISSWQARQTAPDAVVFEVVAPGHTAALEQTIATRLRSEGLDAMSVRIRFVDRIGVTGGGKHRFVINECAKNALDSRAMAV